jgi:hypothetical protein
MYPFILLHNPYVSILAFHRNRYLDTETVVFAISVPKEQNTNDQSASQVQPKTWDLPEMNDAVVAVREKKFTKVLLAGVSPS